MVRCDPHFPYFIKVVMGISNTSRAMLAFFLPLFAPDLKSAWQQLASVFEPKGLPATRYISLSVS